MTDQYLRGILQKYSTANRLSLVQAAYVSLHGVLSNWAGQLIHEIRPSGSFAKGTSISIGTDLDIYCCISNRCIDTLAQLYDKTKTLLASRGYQTKEQNVSIRVTCYGLKCDIVPAKKHFGNTNDASLYRTKTRSWTKTNIHKHVDYVLNSGRTEEIRLFKIWASLNRIEIPSFFLELAVINSLKGARFGDLSNNVVKALTFIRDRIVSSRLLDPANNSNVVSSDMTLAEKRAFSLRARGALSGNWSQFVW